MRVKTRSLDAKVDPLVMMPADGYLWMHGDEGFSAWGSAARIEVGTGEDRFERATFALDSFFSELDGDVQDALALGSFTFDPLEHGSVLNVPAAIVRLSGGSSTLTTIGDELHEPVERAVEDADLKIRYSGSSISEIAWLDAVARAAKAVANEELDKVVLARDIHVWSESELDLRLLAARLRRSFPECFTFVCEGFVGASPELLIRRAGDRVTSIVLAGSAPRGEGAQDRALGEALLASSKDQAEHGPALASVTEVLQRVCTRLDVSPEPYLLRLANVQHLATELTGTLVEDIGALEIAGALHPTAAICGTPTDEAMTMIRDLEGMSRGRYAGPVGWVDAGGDGEWAIALRCAQFAGARGRLFAGGGIVAASEPEAELEETRLKFRAMMSALEGPVSL